MKVVQVVAYYPPHVGGMQNCVKEISERLAKKGQQVEVFTSDIGCKKGKLRPINNLKINYLKSWEFAHTAIIPSLFFKLLKISKDSIIHVHIAHAMIPETVFFVSKIRKIPYVAHIHADVESTGKMGFLLPFYKKIFLRKILNYASKIVVPTKDYIAIISKKYAISKHKIIVIPAGVDLNNFKNISVKLHNPLRFLFVSRLSKGKNLRLLIDSFKMILKRYPNSVLKIVGDGEEKGYVERIIKKENLMNSVKLCGLLVGVELLDVYRESDIFIFTSEYESFGLVLLEAIASGLPVIAPNIESVRTIIKNNKTGILVQPIPEAYELAAGKIIDNEDFRLSLIKNAFSMLKKFSWNKILIRYQQLYKEVSNETK